MSASQRTSRASSRSRGASERATVYSHDAAVERDDQLGFLVYLRNLFLPYLERALAFADRYRLFELVTYVFEEKDEAEEVENATDVKNNPDLAKSMENCEHPAHSLLKKGLYYSEIPVNYFSDLMEHDYKDPNAGTVAIMHYKMNSIYIKRLMEIQTKSPRNTSVKLVTYQEWVDVLLKLNKSLLKNIREIERTLLERFKEIEEVEKSMKRELEFSRDDLFILTRFIRTALLEGYWNKEDLRQLRTVDPNTVFQE